MPPALLSADDPAPPARAIPCTPLPRLDSVAEYGLYVSRRFTQCRRHGGRLALLWLELDLPAPGAATAAILATLLHTVGLRLRKRVREADEVVQLGEHSFAVLLIAAGAPEAQVVEQRLLQVLRGTYGVEGRQLHVGVRVGAAVFPDAGRNGDELAQAARDALPVATAA